MWTDPAILDSFVQVGVTFLQEKAGQVFEYSKKKGTEWANSPRVQNIAMSAIWVLSAVETRVHLFFKGLYDDNRLLRGPVDLFYFIAGLRPKKKMSGCENWFELSKLIKEDDLFYLLTHSIDLDSIDSEIEEKINELVDDMGGTPGVNMFYTMKQGDSFIIRNLEKGTDVCAKESTVRFINIEYTHPLQETPVEIKLDTRMYMVGNELFSPAHVLKLLKDQSSAYHFDMDYEIKLIDNEVKFYTIRSKEYVSIDNEGAFSINTKL
jgi:hypothetical protein